MKKLTTDREALKSMILASVKCNIEGGKGEEKVFPWLMTNNQLLEMLENDTPYADGSPNFLDELVLLQKRMWGEITMEEMNACGVYMQRAGDFLNEYHENSDVSPYYTKFKEQCIQTKTN